METSHQLLLQCPPCLPKVHHFLSQESSETASRVQPGDPACENHTAYLGPGLHSSLGLTLPPCELLAGTAD